MHAQVVRQHVRSRKNPSCKHNFGPDFALYFARRWFFRPAKYHPIFLRINFRACMHQASKIFTGRQINSTSNGPGWKPTTIIHNTACIQEWYDFPPGFYSRTASIQAGVSSRQYDVCVWHPIQQMEKRRHNHRSRVTDSSWRRLFYTTAATPWSWGRQRLDGETGGFQDYPTNHMDTYHALPLFDLHEYAFEAVIQNDVPFVAGSKHVWLRHVWPPLFVWVKVKRTKTG